MEAYPGTGGSARADHPFPHTRGNKMEQKDKPKHLKTNQDKQLTYQSTPDNIKKYKEAEKRQMRKNRSLDVSTEDECSTASVTMRRWWRNEHLNTSSDEGEDDFSLDGNDRGAGPLHVPDLEKAREDRPAKKRSYEREDGDTAPGTEPEPKITTARRGRGRAPTTGKYIGVGKAREATATARREALETELREKSLNPEPAAKAGTSHPPRTTSSPRIEIENSTTGELDTRLQVALAKITQVSQISKNLKGCVKDLKESVAEIKEVTEVLMKRNVSTEVAAYKRRQNHLEEKVKDLVSEIEELRKELREERRKVAGITTSEPRETVEEVVTRVVADMEARFTARLATLEGIRLRPTLAAKETYASKASSKSLRPEPNTGMAAASQPAKETVLPKTQQPSRREKKKLTKAPPEKTTIRDDEWHKVGEKKVATKKKPKKKTPKPTRKLRPPKTSAVVITLQPAAVEKGVDYAQVLRKARDNIDLSALGVESLRLKQARTGARILELPSSTNGDKADALAAKLRETFAPEEVKVARPVKRADVLLIGLDDSVNTAEITTAVVRAGDCSPDQLKVGPIRRRSGAGPGTAVVSCPVAVAKRLVDGRRVSVGWVSAQAKLLPARPARCFKCFAEGHLGVTCQSKIDCSGRCFRCGQPGHVAGNCDAPPHCIICAAANKNADHRVGTKACSPPKKTSRAAASADTPQSNTASAVRVEGVEMES